MGKGEIARYEQFLLFLQCFQMACFPGASKGVIVWEWVNLIKAKILPFARELNSESSIYPSRSTSVQYVRVDILTLSHMIVLDFFNLR